MRENNLINQYRKYREDLDLDVLDDSRGIQVTDYTYILSDAQKRMIMDYNKKHPYDTFKYYFLKSSSSLEEDEKLLNDYFDERWEFWPKQGYQDLRIILDDGMVYANHIPEDSELYKKLIDSINGIKEDLEFEVPMEDGELTDNRSKGDRSWNPSYYVMSTQDRLNFIDWVLKDDNAQIIFHNPRLNKESLHNILSEHLYDRWTLTGRGFLGEDGCCKLNIWNNENTNRDNYSFDIPAEYVKEFLSDEHTADALIEDLDIEDIVKDKTEELADALGKQIGDCIVVGNVIYQMMEDFEIGNDEETQEIPYGIFCIYKVFPNGAVTVFNSKLETCEDVNYIGVKDFGYYAGSVIRICPTLNSFIDFLDSYFGRDWFGEPDEIEAFLDKYDIKEDLDIDDSMELTNYDAVFEGVKSIKLNQEGKENIIGELEWSESDVEGLMDDDWIIVRNSSAIDDSYIGEDDDFQFALLIHNSFYEAFSDSLVCDILSWKDCYTIE